MMKDNYKNILNIFEATKNTERKMTRKKFKSIKKKQVEKTVNINKEEEKKEYKPISNENNINKNSICAISNHYSSEINIDFLPTENLSTNINKSSNFVSTKNVEIYFPNEKKIENISPSYPQFNIYNDNDQNNSFLGEDEKEFIDNLPISTTELRLTTKNINKIISKLKQYDEKSTIMSNRIELQIIPSIKHDINNDYIKQQTFSSDLVNELKNLNKSNHSSELSDNDSISNKKNKFSFYLKETIQNNLLKKPLLEEYMIGLTINNNNDIEQTKNERILLEKDTKTFSCELLITNPIKILFPASKPNKNLVLMTDKYITKSNSSQIEKIKFNCKINKRINSKSPIKCKNHISNSDKEQGTLGITFKKKDKLSYLNKYKTTNSSSCSKNKTNNYHTIKENKNFLINELDEYKKSSNNNPNEIILKERNENINTDIIQSIPDLPKVHSNQEEEYHQYVVVHKQLKYGNKNLDLARKSQITDPKEILYNK